MESTTSRVKTGDWRLETRDALRKLWSRGPKPDRQPPLQICRLFQRNILTSGLQMVGCSPMIPLPLPPASPFLPSSVLTSLSSHAVDTHDSTGLAPASRVLPPSFRFSVAGVEVGAYVACGSSESRGHLNHADSSLYSSFICDDYFRNDLYPVSLCHYHLLFVRRSPQNQNQELAGGGAGPRRTQRIHKLSDFIGDSRSELGIQN